MVSVWVNPALSYISSRTLSPGKAPFIAPVFRSTPEALKHALGAFSEIHVLKHAAPLQLSGGTSHPKWPGPVFPSLSTLNCVRTPTEPGVSAFSNAVVAAASSVLPGVSYGLQRKMGGILQICWPEFPAIASRSRGEAVYSRSIKKSYRKNGRHRHGVHRYRYKFCITGSALRRSP